MNPYPFKDDDMKQKYDLIGDIHGCAKTLEKFLARLGYEKDPQDIYRHRDRKVIFLGDFIDRGPCQREVIHIVRKMIDAEQALSVMGNHEYNAIAFATQKNTAMDDDPDNYLRPHTARNIKQHIQFLKAYSDSPYVPEHRFENWYAKIRGDKDYLEDIEWFKTLPLWKEVNGIRVIHACWDSQLIDKIGDPVLNNDLLNSSSTKGNWQYDAVETLLKGKEIPLPKGHAFKDKDGNTRHNIRVRWWDQEADTYRKAFLGPETASTHIPDDEIIGDHLIEYSHDEPPVFLGHYWLNDPTPVPLAGNIACLDYSVAKPGGKLTAYRWNGETDIQGKHYEWIECSDWPGFSETGSILLPLSSGQFEQLAPLIEIEGQQFEIKDEFHITVMSKKSGANLEMTVLHDPVKHAELARAYKSTNWSFHETSELRLIQREKPNRDGEMIKQQSIIVVLKMPGLDNFYNALKEASLIDASIPVPPPHLTLYTNNCDSGIGIPDWETLQNQTMHTYTADEFDHHG